MTYPYSTPAEVRKLEVFDHVPERAMVIFAHPDDAEIGAGATAALWAGKGCEVTFVQCTTGSSGSNDRSKTSEEMAKIRAEEQLAALETIGASNLVALQHEDGKLESSREFLGQVVHAIRKYRPEVVFAHDPYRKNNFQHRDHRNVGITTMDAVYPYARDHLHFPEHIEEEGLEPHKVRYLMFWGADEADTIVDVSASVDTKIEALMKHASQIPGLSFGSETDLRIRDRHRLAAKGYGFEFGEAFRKLTARA